MQINTKVKKDILSQDGECTITKISDESEKYTMTVYQVFPGVKFIYMAAQTQSVCFDERCVDENLFEISYCREGRTECNINGEFCYLSRGDLSIEKTSRMSPKFCFPLKHYNGITIQIDLAQTPKCLSCFLRDVRVSPKAIAEKFCSGKVGFVIRANQTFEHIFSELYSVPQQIRKGYLKIKTLELLLFLSALDIEQDEFRQHTYTKTQVDLAKNVSRYLTEHMDDRITAERLSEIFSVSTTHIKNTFKGVYGVPIGAYIRTQKMESAAHMLEYTQKSIMDIASEHGYDNSSKFASAFRAVKGVAPNEYRNLTCRNKI